MEWTIMLGAPIENLNTTASMNGLRIALVEIVES
jgi:hypothetical protein